VARYSDTFGLMDAPSNTQLLRTLYEWPLCLLERVMIKLIPRLLLAAGLGAGLASSDLRGQALGTPFPSRETVDATLAALLYLFATDSIASVSWPSPRALLADRSGVVALAGISTRMGEDPALAIAVTERVVAALNDRGIHSRAVSRASTREYCSAHLRLRQ
jgi:hypothetical protein